MGLVETVKSYSHLVSSPSKICYHLTRVDMIYVAPPHKLGALGTQSPWIVPPHVGCRAKFGRSRSNCVSISTGVQNRERWSPVFPLGWDAVNNLSWHAEFDGTSIREKEDTPENWAPRVPPFKVSQAVHRKLRESI